VSVRTSKLLLKEETRIKDAPICVEDPFETDFNCARLIKPRSLERVLEAFEYSLKLLNNNHTKFDVLLSGPSQK